MLADARPSDLFHQYYRDWITVYKEGAVRNVTLDKYLLTHEWLKRLAPNLQLKDLNRIAYQTILNGYAEKHERQTTMDFHHQMKGAILDAVDDGLIDRDPTRKAIIKGKAPRPKKQKYLNQFELHRLLSVLDLGESISWDWMILLIAKTGLRFSEALAITPEDFDFTKQNVGLQERKRVCTNQEPLIQPKSAARLAAGDSVCNVGARVAAPGADLCEGSRV